MIVALLITVCFAVILISEWNSKWTVIGYTGISILSIIYAYEIYNVNVLMSLVILALGIWNGKIAYDKYKKL